MPLDKKYVYLALKISKHAQCEIAKSKWISYRNFTYLFYKHIYRRVIGNDTRTRVRYLVKLFLDNGLTIGV